MNMTVSRETLEELGLWEILCERIDQVTVHGWTLEHDEEHGPSALLKAASAYTKAALIALRAPAETRDFESFVNAHPDRDAYRYQLEQMRKNYVTHILGDIPPEEWPWGAEWWKPSTDPTANMRKAGALVAAAVAVQRARESSSV